MLRFKSDITTISYLQIDILIFEHNTKKSNSEVYLYIIILKDIYYIIDGILFKFFYKKN